MIAGEEIVLAAQGQRPDGILNAVVIDMITAIQHVSAQPGKESIGIDQRLAHPGFGFEQASDSVHPLFELADDGIGLLLASLQDGIGIQFGLAHLFLYPIQLANVDDRLARVLLVFIEGFHELAPLIESL